MPSSSSEQSSHWSDASSVEFEDTETQSVTHPTIISTAPVDSELQALKQELLQLRETVARMDSTLQLVKHMTLRVASPHQERYQFSVIVRPRDAPGQYQQTTDFTSLNGLHLSGLFELEATTVEGNWYYPLGLGLDLPKLAEQELTLFDEDDHTLTTTLKCDDDGNYYFTGGQWPATIEGVWKAMLDIELKLA